MPKGLPSTGREMMDMDWLCHYQYIETIEQALGRISLRISSKPDLTRALVWYRANSERVDISGLAFYQMLIKYSKQQANLLGGDPYTTSSSTTIGAMISTFFSITGALSTWDSTVCAGVKAKGNQQKAPMTKPSRKFMR